MLINYIHPVYSGIMIALFWIVGIPYVISQTLEPITIASLYSKQYVDKKPIPYVEIREANVMWLKRVWRDVDMRQIQNLPFYFPIVKKEYRVSFAQLLIESVQNKFIIAYSAIDSSSNGSGDWDDTFQLPLNVKEAKRALSYKENVIVEDDFGDEVVVEQIMTISLDEITSFRIKEEVFFDKERSIMETRILGIALLIPDKASGREDIKKEAFWIYFPQARNVLARMLSYNTFNDANVLTYDEIFVKRKFSSRITKISNVYDRSLDSYLAPMDALIMAEKLEQEIFQSENDLWSF